MKRIAFLLSVLLVCFFSTHVTSSQDVNVRPFWDSVRRNTPDYVKYQSSYKKSKVDARLAFVKMVSECTRSLESNDVDVDSVAASASYYLTGYKHVIPRIIFYKSTYPNMGVTANGYVLISTSLFALLSEDEFWAVCAHEAAHLQLKHGEVSNYREKKQERDNNTLAIVTASIYAAGQITSQAILANAGIQSRPIDYSQMTQVVNSLAVGAARDKYYFGMAYSRQQEIEADRVAVDFLGYVGIGADKFISALIKLKTYALTAGNGRDETTADDSHPSFTDRIALINRYVAQLRKPFKARSKNTDDLYN